MENIVYVTGNVIKGAIQPLHVNINLTIYTKRDWNKK